MCVCVLNAFCDHCSQVKWQTLRIRQFASSFALTLRRRLLRHMQKHKPLNSIQVSEVARIWLGFWMFTLPTVMSDWIRYGILHILLSTLQNEAVPQDQTVNQQFYTGVLKRMGQDFGRKCPNKWGTQTGLCIMTITRSKAVCLCTSGSDVHLSVYLTSLNPYIVLFQLFKVPLCSSWWTLVKVLSMLGT
jgi:hypothetical protein